MTSPRSHQMVDAHIVKVLLLFVGLFAGPTGSFPTVHAFYTIRLDHQIPTPHYCRNEMPISGYSLCRGRAAM
ncbi:hypothetical protein DFH94DRAFT_762066 [Russula ochroleuca]|uniref:Uncharacterized protein n=1 Tax=Russula ochroleuca TaxID=152965 RepID=A0A9P5K0Z0_9AGAM|nr:hypothetical protein DFH94DRAFT_762066 [Russula ochroleuca]